MIGPDDILDTAECLSSDERRVCPQPDVPEGVGTGLGLIQGREERYFNRGRHETRHEDGVAASAEKHTSNLGLLALRPSLHPLQTPSASEMRKEDEGTACRSCTIRERLDLPNTPSSHVDPGLWSKTPRPTVVAPKNSGVPAHFLDHVLETSLGDAAARLRVEAHDRDAPTLPEREYPNFFVAIRDLATRFRHSYAPFATYNSVARTIRLFGPDAVQPSPDWADEGEWVFRIEDVYMFICRAPEHKGMALG
ncbi:hypothetical protein DL766_007418 [Monosporascus sp. MC13-8B]|uniref:N-acetyltransferase domain-containing protein n=1 Tax=Monosporascus cannonballus TaxID=155416 RepID=A0ABY0GSN4_9PEZI|nr:hypothetical protein DL762_009698 [Monosporascus cannonballus]RYO80463.1 hypothetical protein DL763_008908 [Monosporascus cannonballus]RYP23911.1 hypothetical protein DL766_007418 [Monosporascus sp. MC13-8B]